MPVNPFNTDGSINEQAIEDLVDENNALIMDQYEEEFLNRTNENP